MAAPKVKIIHFNPILWLKRHVQVTVVLAPLFMHMTGGLTPENQLLFVSLIAWLYSAVIPGALLTGWSVIKDDVPPFKIDLPSDWMFVAAMSVPSLVSLGHSFAAVVVTAQCLFSLSVWHRSKSKPTQKEWAESEMSNRKNMDTTIRNVLEDVLGKEEARKILGEAKKEESNGGMCEHIRVYEHAGERYLTHDLEIMFELASTLGKMVAIMDEDDANAFVDSFTTSTALERWTCELMETVAEDWKAGKIAPNKKRHIMRKYMEDKITSRIRDINEKKAKEKSNG
jgi:hypothetical protein